MRVHKTRGMRGQAARAHVWVMLGAWAKILWCWIFWGGTGGREIGSVWG